MRRILWSIAAAIQFTAAIVFMAQPRAYWMAAAAMLAGAIAAWSAWAAKD